MKKYILLAAAALSTTLFSACDDMLDTDPAVTDMTSSTFPGKPADVEALNTATYSIMNALGGGDADSYNIFWWWEVMSDNCYGSGGLQDNKAKALHYLVMTDENQYEGPFISLYGGVSRANNQIETIDNFAWTGGEENAQRKQLLGEAYFMRGLYTLWLTQLYGDVPVITSTTITPEMEQQVSADSVAYPQILSDFVSAKNLMSGEKKAGHANKYAAEAFMARAYMFWAGFYQNIADVSGSCPAIALVEQDHCTAKTLSKQDVIDALVDIKQNGGYKLCDDYRSLWQYSNSLLWDEAHDGVGHAYQFIADMDRNNCFDMPGMGNGNTEELFQIQFMNASSWSIPSDGYSTSRGYCNYLGCWWGLRVNGDNGDKDHTYPFNEGWGQGTPSVNIWKDWTAAERNSGDDIRKLGSLIDCKNELAKYSFVKDDSEESGYAVKKWCGVTLDACAAKNDTWWSKAPGYSTSSLGNAMQGDHFMDFYLMRYADVLLMHSELTGTADGLNEVQRRAGVAQTGYSLKALQDERRWEFAFEGIRYNDMRRWTGNKPTESSYAPKALQAQAGNDVICYGDKTVTMKHISSSWTQRYIDTNGFVAKPASQINLMNGKLVHNPGWDGSEKTRFVALYY